MLSQESTSVQWEILASFSDSNSCWGHWLLFIYFNFTPFWGKTGTLTSEGLLYLTTVSLGQLPVFDTLSPGRWGRSSPCGNRLSGDPNEIMHAKHLGQRSPPYTGFHHYVVPSGPRIASYPCLCKQWKKLPNTQILIIPWILVPTTFFRSISRHPMHPHSECPVDVTLCHQVPKPWADLLSLSLHFTTGKGWDSDCCSGKKLQ